MFKPDHANESGASLALMARMAIALGCDAGMVGKDTLCIELSYGKQLTWHIPEPNQALFAGLPPYPRPLTRLEGDERAEVMNAAYELPQDWLLKCAATLEGLGIGFSNAYRTVLATEVWRDESLRHLKPDVAARLWCQDSGALSHWVAKYSDLLVAADERHHPERMVALDDYSEIGRLAALTPQYKTFPPEVVHLAVEEYRRANDLPAPFQDELDPGHDTAD